MIHQFTVLVSLALLLLMTNDVALVILATGAESMPCVPPGVLQLTMIMLPVATAVVFTVTVPATRVAVPMLALLPVAIFSLLPGVVRDMLPVTSTASVGAVVAPKPVLPTKLFVVEDPVWYTPLALLELAPRFKE